MGEPKKNNGKKIITIIAGIYLLYTLGMNFIGGSLMSNNDKEACETAERRVQSDVYQDFGKIPVTASKVIYQNNDRICVLVKYSFSEEGLKDSYGVKAVSVSKYADVPQVTNVRVDYDNVPDELVRELKVLWELK